MRVCKREHKCGVQACFDAPVSVLVLEAKFHWQILARGMVCRKKGVFFFLNLIGVKTITHEWEHIGMYEQAWNSGLRAYSKL